MIGWLLTIMIRAEIVRWVAQNLRPLSIVEDPAFHSLMKTGRPEYYIPSRFTVSRDVKTVFVNARKHIARILQEHDGALNFATDAWTSPNQKAFIAVTVHFELKGEPMSFLLDIVEVAKSHSGVNLAAAFAKTLFDFGIEHKVSIQHENRQPQRTYRVSVAVEHYLRQRFAKRYNGR
jgi:hypothetical protein